MLRHPRRQPDQSAIPARSLTATSKGKDKSEKPQDDKPAAEQLRFKPADEFPIASGSRTPLPSPTSEALSPAWDPSSRSPLPSSGQWDSWDLASLSTPQLGLSTAHSLPPPPACNPPARSPPPARPSVPMSLSSEAPESRASEAEDPTPTTDGPCCAPLRQWHWLLDESFKKCRLQVAHEKRTQEILEFVRTEDDRMNAVVRDKAKQRLEKLDDLVAIRPKKVGDCVIPLSGSEKGKLCKIKEFRDDGQCAIREVGLRPKKGDLDPVYRITELARTFLYR